MTLLDERRLAKLADHAAAQATEAARVQRARQLALRHGQDRRAGR